jgi:hypothetical protein
MQHYSHVISVLHVLTEMVMDVVGMCLGVSP